MNPLYYEIEIAYRHEQLLRTRREAGHSRRDRRRLAALAAHESIPRAGSPVRRVRPVRRLVPQSHAG